jgi:hypothetical protein
MRRVTGLIVTAVTAFALPAAADPCMKIGGLYSSAGCNPPPERSSDQAEAAFWQRRSEGPGDGRQPEPLFPLPFPPDRRRPGPLPSPAGPTKEGPTTLDDLHLEPDGHGGYNGRRPGFRFGIDRDGTLHFADKPPVEVTAIFLFGLAAVFDLTDVILRMHGDDPYSYDKSLVMSLTRPMRERMTDADRTQRLAGALRALPRELTALWRRPDLAAPARRALLFALWDDLAETGDDPELRAASEARTLLLDFVRAELPAGSPQAFTPDELARWNAERKSRAAFAPY